MLNATYIINQKTYISSDRFCDGIYQVCVRLTKNYFIDTCWVLRYDFYAGMYVSGSNYSIRREHTKFVLSQLRAHYSAMESFRRV
jgi:hypothetical protein